MKGSQAVCSRVPFTKKPKAREGTRERVAQTEVRVIATPRSQAGVPLQAPFARTDRAGATGRAFQAPVTHHPLPEIRHPDSSVSVRYSIHAGSWTWTSRANGFAICAKTLSKHRRIFDPRSAHRRVDEQPPFYSSESPSPPSLSSPSPPSSLSGFFGGTP